MAHRVKRESIKGGGGMKIKEIVSQNRRDFTAIYECEHCGTTKTAYGYDDTHFHNNVIPDMECKACDKKALENYRPLSTMYSDFDEV